MSGFVLGWGTNMKNLKIPTPTFVFKSWARVRSGCPFISTWDTSTLVCELCLLEGREDGLKRWFFSFLGLRKGWSCILRHCMCDYSFITSYHHTSPDLLAFVSTMDAEEEGCSRKPASKGCNFLAWTVSRFRCSGCSSGSSSSILKALLQLFMFLFKYCVIWEKEKERRLRKRTKRANWLRNAIPQRV